MISIKRTQLGAGYSIQYATLPNGELLIAGMMDPLFNEMTEIVSHQMELERRNKDTKERYLEQLNNFQTALDSGRSAGMTAPEVPKMTDLAVDFVNGHLVSIETLVAFPSLPTPIYPKVSPSK